MNEFPEYARYMALLYARDSYVMMCAGIAVMGLIWLWNARFVWPKFLPLARWGLLAVFWGSALVVAISIAGGIL